jgi:FkbM family methyltransferase
LDESAFQPYVVRNRRMGPHTYDLWITDLVAAAWYGHECHDLRETSWCLAHIREGMKIADCGAHHGCLTVVFSKAVGPTGRVGAWEAVPQNAAVIEKNLTLNRCTNAIVRPFALGDERKRMPLPSDDISGNTVFARDGQEADKTKMIEVEFVRLDDEIPKDIRVDFIKIDVEGSDLQMMRGAQRILSQRPIIDLEIHNFLFRDRKATLSEMFGMLAPLQYAYSVLPRAHEGAVQAVGWDIDLSELASYDNPHVFCLPVWAQTAPTSGKRRWWQLGGQGGRNHGRGFRCPTLAPDYPRKF